MLDDYVNSEALVTRADELGYRVSDQELLEAMAQVPAFQVDGKFDQAHALAVLKAQGRSIAEIEELFRRDVKLRQLDNALILSSFATPTELKQLRALTRQQRELAWLTLPAAKYAAEATPDDAARQGVLRGAQVRLHDAGDRGSALCRDQPRAAREQGQRR